MRKIWRFMRRQFLGRLILRLLSFFYYIGWHSRRYWFSWAGRTGSVSATVISVGNITAGGTGKTTLVVYLAERLTREGFSVFLLSRGYKGGDEARLIEEKFKVHNLPERKAGSKIKVLVGHNRYQLASSVLKSQSVPESRRRVFILDDAHQHGSLKKDLSIVLVDVMDRSGLDGLLPYGLLREPLAWGLKRADLVILTHADLADPAQLMALARYLERICFGLPIFYAGHSPVGFRSLTAKPLTLDSEESLLDCSVLDGKPVLLVSGIGNPLAFEETVRRRGGATILKHFEFEDHALYTLASLKTVLHACQSLRPAAVITTAKDGVRLKGLTSIGQPWPCPWYALEVSWRFRDHEEEFWKIVASKTGQAVMVEINAQS